MFDPRELPVFLAATLALNVTPGPDMLYVATRSMAEGRRAGLVSALGIAGGGAVHTLLVTLGLAGLLHAVPLAYDAVRFLGAGYLVFLGSRALFARGGGVGARAQLAPASAWGTFRQGVVTNVLNPKVALFFLAFLPQFAHPERGSVALQLLVLGALFNASGTLVNAAVAWGASAAGAWGRARWGRALARLSGLVFIGLGVRLALAERR